MLSALSSSTRMYDPELVTWAQLYITEEYIGRRVSRRKFTSVTLVYMTLRYLGLGYSGVIHLERTSVTTLYQRISRMINSNLNSVASLAAGISIVSNLSMFGSVLTAANRINVAGFNVCDIGAPASLSWVTPTSNTLWMTYETILCGAVLRYAFKEIPASSWRSPTRVTFSMLIAILNATGVTSNISAIENGSSFLVSLQVAMIGPWIIINLRRSYERTANPGASESWEMTTVAFASDEPWPKSGHEA
ncbi:hypothetical protein CONPUDRAFT_74457 [Coniophora puteana RWD-64-598 SS2]|uniref:Uncharacterized protein n=1 Tax=Coniophora puteana (strain RWD-64-598) TaxID=741705 RepID=A0A5M3MI01_CONPW|nr:uncharacterized protein CONPUDRAFT_74457 [Coniophora puteana RWD-64-598 SS2]EIW78869.1 hypothetical protein CONPUDRAFT_74457 [Coniophora puteana RWD-64-598 SS2]